MKWYKDDYVLTDDRTRVDIGKVTELLSDTYWAKDRPPELVRKSIENSMCFSIFFHNTQIGFCRVATDYAVFAWIADIIIHPEHRGKGLGKLLISIIVKHPDIPGSLQLLKTKDAHSLYEKFGFRIDECMENLVNQLADKGDLLYERESWSEALDLYNKAFELNPSLSNLKNKIDSCRKTIKFEEEQLSKGLIKYKGFRVIKVFLYSNIKNRRIER